MKYRTLLFSLLFAGLSLTAYSNHESCLPYLVRIDSANQPPSSVQCSGKTKMGNRCKNKTRNESGYCHVHEKQIVPSGKVSASLGKPVQQLQGEVRVQCSGLTKAGKRCRRTTKNVNGRCFQHQ